MQIVPEIEEKKPASFMLIHSISLSLFLFCLKESAFFQKPAPLHLH